MISSSLLRLIDYDYSNDFKIIVKINKTDDLKNDDNIQISKETTIIINTTINKARVISRNIDELYKNDQTINEYEIKLNNIKEKNKTGKIVDIFNILLKSIGRPISISKSLENMFLIVESELGEDTNFFINNNDYNNNDNKNDNINNKDNKNDKNNKNNNDDEIGYSDLFFMYNLKINKNKREEIYNPRIELMGFDEYLDYCYEIRYKI